MYIHQSSRMTAVLTTTCYQDLNSSAYTFRKRWMTSKTATTSTSTHGSGQRRRRTWGTCSCCRWPTRRASGVPGSSPETLQILSFLRYLNKRGPFESWEKKVLVIEHSVPTSLIPEVSGKDATTINLQLLNIAQIKFFEVVKIVKISHLIR